MQSIMVKLRISESRPMALMHLHVYKVLRSVIKAEILHGLKFNQQCLFVYSAMVR